MENIEKIQNIHCKNGRCFDLKKTHFDTLFEEGNIVDDIEKEIFIDSYYGG